MLLLDLYFLFKRLGILFFVVCCFTTGVFAQQAVKSANIELTQQPAAKIVKLYPNPASAVLNIDIKKGATSNYALQILNSIGKTIVSYKNVSGNFSINLKDQKLYRGIYIYQLYSAEGRLLEAGKFLVIN